MFGLPSYVNRLSFIYIKMIVIYVVNYIYSNLYQASSHNLESCYLSNNLSNIK